MKVYFIKPVGVDGPIKIGVTDSPMRRLGQINGWSPVPLEIAATVDGDGEIEERFHSAFIEHHDRLEWFRGHADILNVIERINDGSFDIDTLPYACGRISGLAERKASWAAFDYEYHGLYRAYCSRDVAVMGWFHDALPSANFAKLSHRSKLRRFDALRKFMAEYTPATQASAA